MCPILRGKMGLDTPPALGARACEMGGAGGARLRGWFAWFGAGCLSRRYWGLRPLAPWGGLSCGLAALYLGTHDVWLLFPLRDLPARSAGRRRGSLVVAEARPSAQLPIPGLTANSAARAKPSAYDTRKPVKDSSRLRHAPKRFSLGRHSRFFGQDQRNGVACGSCRGPRHCFFYASAMTSTSQSMFFGRVLTATQLRAGLPVK